jgi:hypothetical protein
MACYALLYSLKPGAAEQADEIYQTEAPPGTGVAHLLSSTVFRRGDMVVQVYETGADSDAAIEGVLATAASPGMARRLAPLLDTDADLTTAEGLRGFFRDQMMTAITHREASGLPQGLADSERFAITFAVKPGAEGQAAEILSAYDPPQARIDEDTWLMSTTVFMKGPVIVRVMDVHGSLPKVMAHLSRQPAIRATEDALDPILQIPRDMSTTEGARAFFMQAMMQRITHG